MSKKILFTLFVSIVLILIKAVGVTFEGCSKQPTEPIITHDTQFGLPADTTLLTDQGRDRNLLQLMSDGGGI